MTSSPPSQPSDVKTEWFERFGSPVLIGTAVATLVFVLATLDWLLGALSAWSLFEPALSGTLALSFLGAAASLFGVYLAIRIFVKQSERTAKDNENNEVRLTQHDQLLEEVRQIARATHAVAVGFDAKLDAAARVQDAQPTDPDAPVDESDDTQIAEASQIAYLNGERRAVFYPSDVPLWTVADVMQKWTEDGATGRWNLSTLIGAYRSISADGSFRGQPWTLVFENPDSKELQAWSVYRGGYAKKTATVAAAELPPDES